jgi:MFS superfamily sulfate permease-like transporter
MLAMAATVAIVLLFLTKPLEYMPNAVLAAVMFVIGIKLVDVRHMREILRLRPDEFWIAIATAAVVVGVGVEAGIILAIVLSLLDHVRRHYRPHDSVITVDDRGAPVENPAVPGAVSEPGLVVYRFGAGVFYANASHLLGEALALVDVPQPPRWFVLLAAAVDDVDFTGGETLAELARELARRDIVFAVAMVTRAVRPELDRFGVTTIIGPDHIYATLGDAIAAFRAAS